MGRLATVDVSSSSSGSKARHKKTNAIALPRLPVALPILVLASLASIFGSFTLGLYVAIQGPTLMDLIDLLHVNNDIMSYTLAFASLAYSVGGLSSGFLFNYVNRQILIAGYLFIFGLANIVTPFISNYLAFSIITVFKMMCAGGTDCGTNVWILEMWPGKDAWLQALHFSFAVGCALGPLIVEPFLSVEFKDNEMDKIAGKTSGSTTISDQHTESRIYIPYGVSGLTSISAASIILYLYFLDRRHKRKQAAKSQAIVAASGQQQHQQQIPPEQIPMVVTSSANHNHQSQQQQQQQPQETKITSRARENFEGRPPYYVMLAIALAAMCLSFYCGIEITSMNYLATFAVNIDLQLPKSTAALMSSALTISFAVGRGFGIWIAAYMKPHKLFYLCSGVMAAGNISMLIFANTAEVLLWYSICLFGIGCGPMFPAIVSFYDDKISKVTNTVSGIFILGSMFNVALNSLIIGHHIIDNALILIVCNLIGSVVLLLLFATLHMLTKVKKSQRVRKYKQQAQQQMLPALANSAAAASAAAAPLNAPTAAAAATPDASTAAPAANSNTNAAISVVTVPPQPPPPQQQQQQQQVDEGAHIGAP